MFRRTIATAALVASCVLVPVATAAADDADPSTAAYDGGEIELADGGWDGARACAVIDETSQCFASEAEMNDWLATEASASNPGSGLSALGSGRFEAPSAYALTCASSLRLYEHGGFGGRVLYLSSRGLWFNLRDFSFDNKTSSFKVGACTGYLAEYSSGGGGWYPGSGAYASVPVMYSSWNDRISSTYVA